MDIWTVAVQKQFMVIIHCLIQFIKAQMLFDENTFANISLELEVLVATTAKKNDKTNWWKNESLYDSWL